MFVQSMRRIQQNQTRILQQKPLKNKKQKQDINFTVQKLLKY